MRSAKSDPPLKQRARRDLPRPCYDINVNIMSACLVSTCRLIPYWLGLVVYVWCAVVVAVRKLRKKMHAPAYSSRVFLCFLMLWYAALKPNVDGNCSLCRAFAWLWQCKSQNERLQATNHTRAMLADVHIIIVTSKTRARARLGRNDMHESQVKWRSTQAIAHTNKRNENIQLCDRLQTGKCGHACGRIAQPKWGNRQL